MYHTLKYLNVVNGISEAAMQDAIERVKALPDYAAKGAVNISVILNIHTHELTDTCSGL